MEKIEVIRSGRKTISVEIRRDLRIIVRAPLKMKDKAVKEFVKDKYKWIESHLEKMRARIEAKRLEDPVEPFTDTELEELTARARKIIPPIVDEQAKKIGVTYGKVTVRKQVSRWGSCSQKGNLNFNCLLMLCPDEVLNYVIIHELCHRIYMDHSVLFRKTVKKYCPDCEEQKVWLRTNGRELIRRLRSSKGAD